MEPIWKFIFNFGRRSLINPHPDTKALGGKKKKAKLFFVYFLSFLLFLYFKRFYCSFEPPHGGSIDSRRRVLVAHAARSAAFHI